MTLIWSIVPTEAIFQSDTAPQSELREIQQDGVTVVCSVLGDGRGRVERLISLNPNDYLNPRWQPGSYVRLP